MPKKKKYDYRKNNDDPENYPDIFHRDYKKKNTSGELW